MPTVLMQPTGPIDGVIRPPGSKSITNRALLCAALAEGRSKLRGVLDSDDTRVMLDSLAKLGVETGASRDDPLIIVGCDGAFPSRQADLFVGNSGTTMRFLTAAAAATHGTYRLDGVPRMRERPIGDLVSALNRLGADVQGQSDNRFPPVVINARGLAGGTTSIAGDMSSQFLSGLLMAAPFAARPVTIEVHGQLVSRPYVDMTIAVMETFGAVVSESPGTVFTIDNSRHYRACDYAIEPDASAASYFWAAAAVTGGSVTVADLSFGSLQGDVAFCRCLERMGCLVRENDEGICVEGAPLSGIDVDMNQISDTVQTLAVVSLFATGPTTIRGVGHIRHKETDRIGNLAKELRKLGAAVEELDDGLRVVPAAFKPATLATFDDHRMAMSFAVAGLVHAGVAIEDPDCTAKTYPGFFADLSQLAGTNCAKRIE